MSTDKTISEKIEENALGLASVSADGTTVSAVDIDKQIAAESHLASKNAAKRNHCGLAFRQMTPGGCG